MISGWSFQRSAVSQTFIFNAFCPASSSDFFGLVYWTLALCLLEVNYYLNTII